LRARGLDVVVCRDPGSTPLGERIRELLLSIDSATPINLRSEMLLYMAARAQLVDQLIRPALDTGQVVVADRYLLANVVYQGHAGGLDPQHIWQVGQFATAGLTPDCVFVLDMSIESANLRLNRSLDRMESHGDEYRERVRKGFLFEASRATEQIHVIDAGQSIDAVQADIWRIAAKLLRLPQ
jgi:dTMP kinase